MHLQLGEVSTVVVSVTEFAKEVLKTHDVIFASRPHILSVSIMTYSCTSIAFAPYGSPINLTEELYSSTYSIASRAAFGKTTKEHEGFIYVVKEAMNVAGGFDLADVFPSAHLLHLISGMSVVNFRQLKK
ncbi:hypothetical protein L3X38_024279 [Prunus dulcis]|uniref:Uncharacterized protein n=1 Tax=Prunus dulcis TaxID=3755 RepID=A0AAD4Z698_PRUDU|nr:hypothetical protein L3X38_024279 [Prunus dulcis]